MRRVNYQVRVWKLANIQISEVLKLWEGHGWKEDGEPLWCHDDWILPSSLADIVCEEGAKATKETEDGEEEGGVGQVGPREHQVGNRSSLETSK